MIALFVHPLQAYFVIDQGFELSRAAIFRQLAAMPCDRYLIRLIHHASRKALPGERLWMSAQLADEALIRFLRARNRDGYDVYFRPFVVGRNAGYVLVDLDCAHPGVVDGMFANGHEPCVVAETSPGRLQAWVRVSAHPLPLACATAMARHLAALYQADRASADACHLGRLAGFTNQKKQRRLPTGLAPWVKIRHATLLLASQAPALQQAAELRPAPRGSTVASPKPPAAPADSADGRRSAWDAITPDQAVTVYQTWLRRLRILERFPVPDWSIVDLWIAKELLRFGVPPQQVKTVLLLASPHFPRRHAVAEDYLQRTVARAFHDLAHSPFPARLALSG